MEGQRREALDAILDVADVVLMTQVWLQWVLLLLSVLYSRLSSQGFAARAFAATDAIISEGRVPLNSRLPIQTAWKFCGRLLTSPFGLGCVSDQAACGTGDLHAEP